MEKDESKEFTSDDGVDAIDQEVPRKATADDGLDPGLLRKLERMKNLPTLPAVIGRLQEAISDPDCDATELARIIEDDPSIMTRMLKVVNSALYAPVHGQKIDRILPAVVRLGFETIKNIALSTAVFSAFPSGRKQEFDRTEFWRHSVCVGIAAEVLYDFCSNAILHRLPRDVIHLAGIVHDVGKIVLEAGFEREFHRAIRAAQKRSIPLVMAERDIVGADHAQVGAWLCTKWGIDSRVTEAVRQHHRPDRAEKGEQQSLVMLIHLADYICLVQKLGDSGNPGPTHDSWVREELNLDMKKIGPLMNAVEEEAEKSEVLLSLIEQPSITRQMRRPVIIDESN